MTLKKILIIVAIILSLSTFLFFYITYDSQTFLSLSEEEKLEDYDFLWATLQDSFPFVSLVRKKGINPEEIYEYYKEEVKNSKTDIQFLKAMNSSIQELNGYGHVSMLDPMTYRYYRETYGLDVFNEAVQDQKLQPWIETLNNDKSESVYGQLDQSRQGFRTTKYLKNSSQEKSESQNLNSNSEYENITTKIIKKKDIAYLQINSFEAKHMSSDKKVLFDFYKKISDYSHLIIDIQDNRGGSGLYWRDLIISPNIEKELSYQRFALVKKSINNQPYLDAYFKGQLQRIKELPTFSNLDKQDLEGITDFISVTESVEPRTDEKLFKGKIWVLTSDKVYSSSENFVMFSKNTDFATLVGTSTGGDGGIVDPVYMVLPNSGMIVRYSMLLGLNSDGPSNEEFGTKPEIKVNTNESALEMCLNTIKTFEQENDAK